MKNTEDALKWIVNILNKNGVSFQIRGGFAAKMYGSERELSDIDMRIEEGGLAKILPEIQDFITYSPGEFRDERWDIYGATISYQGQEIDICERVKIFNDNTKEWRDLPVDLSRSVMKEIYGIKIPIAVPEELIAYKKLLIGDHQIEDIRAIENYLATNK